MQGASADEKRAGAADGGLTKNRLAQHVVGGKTASVRLLYCLLWARKFRVGYPFLYVCIVHHIERHTVSKMI